MSWVGVMNGQVVSVFWFIDNASNNVAVNQQRYLEMLQNDVLPKVHQKFGLDLSSYWFQQVTQFIDLPFTIHSLACTAHAWL